MSHPTLADYAKAKAFTLWAQTIINEEPAIVLVDDDYYEVDFTPEQQQKFKEYLHTSIKGMFQPKPTGAEPPNVQIRLGKVILPWSLEYFLPAAAALFGLGYLARHITRR